MAIGECRYAIAHRRPSEYNYFFTIEIIRAARSIIPATHLRKIGISVPPYVFILKGITTTKLPFLPDFLTLQIIEYGPLKFFSLIQGVPFKTQP